MPPLFPPATGAGPGRAYHAPAPSPDSGTHDAARAEHGVGIERAQVIPGILAVANLDAIAGLIAPRALPPNNLGRQRPNQRRCPSGPKHVFDVYLDTPQRWRLDPGRRGRHERTSKFEQLTGETVVHPRRHQNPATGSAIPNQLRRRASSDPST
jgi:hypothetical protein